MAKRKNIVVIGGGTGVFNVLSGLKHSRHNLSAIVTMADDGGSTGFLRAEFGILPPGDIRRVLVALSHNEKTLADLFTYRFEEGKGLAGHSLGNLLLAALERLHGSFDRAVEEAGVILQIRGQVIPVTFDNIRLVAHLADGRIIKGEANIDRPKGNGKRSKIVRVKLIPKAKANPKALEVIRKADLIVLGPGDLYTSIIPNLLVRGIASAITKSRAKKAFVVNIMTKRGETDGFSVHHFVEIVERYLGPQKTLSHIVINTGVPEKKLLKKYKKTEGAELVIYKGEFIRPQHFRVQTASFIRKNSKFIRHDPKKLARALISIVRG